MSLEIYIQFKYVNWYLENKEEIKGRLRNLSVFLDEKDEVIYLRNGEERGEGFFSYDSRFFFEEEYIFLDIFSNEMPIVSGLYSIFSFLKKETKVIIADEDGENVDWFFAEF